MSDLRRSPYDGGPDRPIRNLAQATGLGRFGLLMLAVLAIGGALSNLPMIGLLGLPAVLYAAIALTVLAAQGLRRGSKTANAPSLIQRTIMVGGVVCLVIAALFTPSGFPIEQYELGTFRLFVPIKNWLVVDDIGGVRTIYLPLVWALGPTLLAAGTLNLAGWSPRRRSVLFLAALGVVPLTVVTFLLVATVWPLGA